MKWIRIGQGLLAAAACLGLGLTLTSCSPSDTIDYVFATLNTTTSGTATGEIASYHVDSISGALSEVTGSPFSSGGMDPVAEVPSPNGQILYVANHDSNNIAEFVIGTDGQLSAPANTYTTLGAEPVALAINAADTFLFVVDYYGPGYSDLNPGPGILTVYPINSDGSLGSPVASGGASYTTLQCFPGGVTVTPNGSFAYVSNTNSVVVTTTPPTTSSLPATPAVCPSQGTISGFAIASSGALTPIPGSPFLAGATPTAITTEPSNRFLYTTDSTQNEIIAFSIGTNGALAPNTDGPFATGVFPDGITVDPRDEYIYVTNYNAATISAYVLSQANGDPSANAASTFSTGATGPTCIVVDPSIARFVYTSDSRDVYIGGGRLNPNTGALSSIQNSPYPASGRPTCVTAVPHGNHSTQFISPQPGSSLGD